MEKKTASPFGDRREWEKAREGDSNSNVAPRAGAGMGREFERRGARRRFEPLGAHVLLS